ncbi:uncharacterized protein K489DRAFT_377928 [Dissoconium aciculare CBS 342.82]|uniref:Uncharacterized protein n=1 Tax=Dissoconium aciculare CBS 342.82 TaxID=1314786 RepID=A0A6J3MET7_9PEZI|nr:uncharacterized protein K489DRAFT_377928 [Dissoconium aciculare CBS 342.82]KAF1825377.1 hypothetical protein K489DRAFT_377928 [Dissoconium aciculare CBS 342.82]
MTSNTGRSHHGPLRKQPVPIPHFPHNSHHRLPSQGSSSSAVPIPPPPPPPPLRPASVQNRPEALHDRDHRHRDQILHHRHHPPRRREAQDGVPPVVADPPGAAEEARRRIVGGGRGRGTSMTWFGHGRPDGERWSAGGR